MDYTSSSYVQIRKAEGESMAQLMEYAEYLAKEIGPRPAGTEEEQQAALYITERFQKDSGFAAQIEEFNCSSNIEMLSAVPGLVVIVVAILAMIFPILSLPAFILAVIATVIFVLESFGQPVATRSLARGMSQNVVAKYQPHAGEENARRSRKVVLVAHYDTGKVTPALVKRIESLNLPVPVALINVCGMILASFFLLVHIFVNAGVGGIVVNVLTVICLIVCAYPALKAFLMRSAPYNEGANNNATGTAALVEVARRISRGSMSEADLANDPAYAGVSIHGEAAAWESGLVPEGAQIRYEAEQLVPPAELGEYDEEERLLAAKAAIAAMTGRPVERRTYGSVASKLVNSRAHDDDFEPARGEDAEAVLDDAGIDRPADNAAEYEPADAPEIDGPRDEGASDDGFAPVVWDSKAPATFSAPANIQPETADTVAGYTNAPSWFVSAQQNAKKPAGETGPIQRSRYAEAIEAAEREADARERERAERERVQREEELKAREEAARAAISASLTPKAEDIPMVIEPVEAEADAAEEAPAASAAPAAPAAGTSMSFIPYAEAHPDDVVAVSGHPGTYGGRPADDEFAASLGSTTAFDPRMVNETTAGAPSAQGRLSGLPSIDAAPSAGKSAANDNPSRSGMFRKLRTDVPSLSGVIRMQEAGEDVSQKPAPWPPEPPAPAVDALEAPVDELPGSYDPTVALRPEEAPEPVDYDMELADERAGFDGYEGDYERGYEGGFDDYADDYDRGYDDERGYDDDYREPAPRRTERGRGGRSRGNSDARPSRNRRSRAGGRAEKPKKGGFFSRFLRKDAEELEDTPQEWLEVDDDFDARTVGRERGGWESFRDDRYDDYDRYEDNDDYDEFEEFDGYDDRGGYRDDYRDDRPSRRWEGGSYSRVRLGRVDTRSGEDSIADRPHDPIDLEEDALIAEEIEQIYHFRNPLFNTEIWFVALGAECTSHDGVKAFLAEHSDDLRGAMFIEVESLGLGELAIASEEGRIRPMLASSRVKRYTRSATAATGIAPGSVNLAGFDSAASLVQAAGYQSMHLLGVEDGAPALKGSADDVLENVDDLLFDDNVNFIMELLKK